MAKSVIAAVPKTKSVYVNALLWGGNRWDQKTGAVTYAFDTNADQHVDGQTPKVTVQAWQAAEKAAVKLALSLFSNVADIAFSASKTAASANLQLSKGVMTDPGTEGALAFMNPPGEPYEGTAFFNVKGHANWSGHLGQGGFAFATLIHELGHGVGLAHPHDDGGGSSLFPGVDGYDKDGFPILDEDGELDPQNDTGDSGLNIGLWTMMSYNSVGQDYAPARQANFGIEGTPMALDVAALQHLYGANMRFRTGSDTYALPQADGPGTFWSCLWDAGGIDTISNAGSARAAVIDLRAAPLTGPNAGGYVSAIAGKSVHGGFTIAHGVTIENAIGGKGNDAIIGNDAANRIDGGAGDDRMAGRGGNDIYRVDSRNDVVLEVNGQGTDTVISAVSYALGAGSAVEHLELAPSTGTANLVLIGNAFSNTLRGNAGDNLLDGRDGADTLIGGAGNDSYVADTAADRIFEARGGGIDTVYAAADFTLRSGQEIEVLRSSKEDGTRALTFTGNAFANTLRGNAGDDTLDGKAGADTLVGLRGDDHYVVDHAGDRVVERAGEGDDTVATSVSYRLEGGQEIENLVAQGSGTSKADIALTGNAFGQVVVGNLGANRIDGGLGRDDLSGLAGRDTFVFSTKLGAGNVDTIADFNGFEDRIELSKAIFSTLTVGRLSESAFKAIDHAKVDADDRILYKEATGQLFYDADGSGKGAASLFAEIGNHEDLRAIVTAGDILVA